jgi:membrane-associated phospholipid phosphatase
MWIFKALHTVPFMTHRSPSPDARRLRAAAVGGLCLAAVGIAGAVLGNRVPPLDGWIVGHLYSRPHTAPAVIATVISGVGTLFGLTVLIATVTGLLWRHRARGVRLLPRYGLLLLACLAVLALQAVFQRSGPPVTSQDWTYPSGHVTVLAALIFTAFMISMYLTPAWRVTVLAGGAVMLLLVAAGRVTLGEHYLVDVVAAVPATIGAGLLAAGLSRLPLPRVKAAPNP